MASERPTIEELARRCRMLNGIYKGTFWRHVQSGGLYEITGIGIRESDYAPIVHYCPVNNPDLTFDRVMTEWRELVGEDMPHPRFAMMERTFQFRPAGPLTLPADV